MIQGKITGLKQSQISALERIPRRKVPAGELISAELARYLTELSRDIQRQVGTVDHAAQEAGGARGEDRCVRRRLAFGEQLGQADPGQDSVVVSLEGSPAPMFARAEGEAVPGTDDLAAVIDVALTE